MPQSYDTADIGYPHFDNQFTDTEPEQLELSLDIPKAPMTLEDVVEGRRSVHELGEKTQDFTPFTSADDGDIDAWMENELFF